VKIRVFEIATGGVSWATLGVVSYNKITATSILLVSATIPMGTRVITLSPIGDVDKPWCRIHIAKSSFDARPTKFVHEWDGTKMLKGFYR
jgi:hypothetical protein